MQKRPFQPSFAFKKKNNMKRTRIDDYDIYSQDTPASDALLTITIVVIGIILATSICISIYGADAFIEDMAEWIHSIK